MPRIHTRDDGVVRILTLDDGKANVIQEAFLTELDAALDAALADGVGAVLLTGRAGFFSAGLDLKTLPTLDTPELMATLSHFGASIMRLWSFPLPLVAAATGHALAGGAVMLLCADHRIGPRGKAKIGLNEVAIGLPLPTFVVELARSSLDPRRLRQTLLQGRVYDVETAREVGFLDEVVDADEVLATGLERARQLATLPAQAYGPSKERLRAPAHRAGLQTYDADLERFLAVGPLAARG